MFPKSVVVKIVKHLKLQDFSLPTYVFKIKLAVDESGKKSPALEYYWRPLSLETPHIFVEDPHIFIGDPSRWKAPYFRWRPSYFYWRPQDFHWGTHIFVEDTHVLVTKPPDSYLRP